MASSSARRPEETGPADLFYDSTEARKYLHSSRMIEVQTNMAERALEMLCLREDEPSLLLDVGCGTGLSGEVLEEAGHTWVGCDVSRDMLHIAREEREVEGDLVHDDMGRGLPFRQGMFDGAISISAVQWLCYANSEAEGLPRARLHRFFQSLYKCLRRGARAVLQFYPQDANQLQLITAAAMRAGFGGGLVVDFPHSTKAKKYFLCLLAGPPDADFQMPCAMGGDAMSMVSGVAPSVAAHQADGGAAARNESRKTHAKRKLDSRQKARHGRIAKKSREWILLKKEAMRKQGREVTLDSKYTGRKRSKVRF
jgi:18S rRNA (guanine1575-N7)-methyltransferase